MTALTNNTLTLNDTAYTNAMFTGSASGINTGQKGSTIGISGDIGAIRGFRSNLSSSGSDTSVNVTISAFGNWFGFSCLYASLGSNYQMSGYGANTGTSFKIKGIWNNNHISGGGGLFIRIS